MNHPDNKLSKPNDSVVKPPQKNEGKKKRTAEEKAHDFAKARVIRDQPKEVRLDQYVANPDPGYLAPYKVGYGPQQVNSVEKSISDLDRFLLAKYYPGQIQTPYMNGITRLPLPTSTFQTSLSLSTATRTSAINSPGVALGTDPYLLLAFCPALTLATGTGGGTQHSQSTHLSGFLAVQGGLNDVPLNVDGFDRVVRSPSCQAFYGTNFDTYAQTGLIFSAKIDFSILTPMANLVGSRFSGTLTLASIPSTGLSFSKLIQISRESSTAHADITLRGAVVNNALPTSVLAQNTNDTFADFSNEIVHYVILQTPVISITTGALNYSLIGSTTGNYVWWPTVSDSFAQNMGTVKNDSAPGTNYLVNQIYSPLINLASTSLKDVLRFGAKSLIPMIAGAVHPALGVAANSVMSKVSTRPRAVLSSAQWLERRVVMDNLAAIQRALTNLRFTDLQAWNEGVSAAIDNWRECVENYPSDYVPSDLPVVAPDYPVVNLKRVPSIEEHLDKIARLDKRAGEVEAKFKQDLPSLTPADDSFRSGRAYRELR